MTVRFCTCSHAEGDHRSSGSRFPHVPVYGVCLVPGCGCARYVADGEQARAEEWLARFEDGKVA